MTERLRSPAFPRDGGQPPFHPTTVRALRRTGADEQMAPNTTTSRNAAVPRRRGDMNRPEFSVTRTATLRTIGRLQSGYQRDVSVAVAAVARLRREAGRMPLADPSAWGLDDAEELVRVRQERLEEAQERQDGWAVNDVYFSSKMVRQRAANELREETAVHLAVTLWALHQQALRDVPMHLAGWPLGRAVRRLAHGRTGTIDGPDGSRDIGGKSTDLSVEEASETIRKRFVRIGASSDINTLARRLREMVLLLRGARIPLDYGLLAEQIFFWQDSARRAETSRAWGREFHTLYRSRPEQETAAPDNEPSAPTTDLDADGAD